MPHGAQPPARGQRDARGERSLGRTRPGEHAPAARAPDGGDGTIRRIGWNMGGTPRSGPAPPRNSAMRGTSTRQPLPSRAGPLRDDDEPGIPPDDDPTPGPQATSPTSGWRSDASPSGAPARTQRTGRARTRKQGRARRRPYTPRTAGTVRPRKDCRSSRSGWTPGTDRLQAVHRRARCCALRREGSGVASTRA